MSLISLSPDVIIINPKAQLTNYYVWRFISKRYEEGAIADCLILRTIKGKREDAVSFNHSNKKEVSEQALQVHHQIRLKKDDPARYIRVNAKELCEELNEETEIISFHDDGGYPHINMRYSPAILADSQKYREIRTMIVEEAAEYYKVSNDNKVSPFP